MGFLDFLSNGIVNSVGKVADELITSDEERLEKENEKLKANIQYKLENKKLDYDLLKNENDNITERWVSDNQGNFLTKSVRPLTLYYLLGVTTIMAFIDGNFMGLHINSAFIDMYQLLMVSVFSAFFGGKTIERLKGKG